MGIGAVLEFALSVTRFKNVDLHNQGLYRLSISLSKNPDGKRHEPAVAGDTTRTMASKLSSKRPKSAHLTAPLNQRCTAYACFSTPMNHSTVKGTVVSDSLDYVVGPRIDDINDVFYSKTFRVRYIDEERILNDGVQFRVELDALLERAMAFDVLICLERANTDDFDAKRDREKTFEFETLSERRILLNYSMEGLKEYVPVIFDDCSSLGFCLVETCIHSCITNMRYEAFPYHEKTSRAKFSSSLLSRPQSNPSSEVDPASMDEFLFKQFKISTREQSNPDDSLGPQRFTPEYLATLMRSVPAISEDPTMAQFLESTRGACLYSLRNSYVCLQKSIAASLNVAKTLDRSNIGPLSPLSNLELRARLFNRRPGKVASAFNNVSADADVDSSSGVSELGVASGEDTANVWTIEQFAAILATEMDQISSTLLLAWHEYVQSLQQIGVPIMGQLKTEWLTEVTERVGESIIRESCDSSAFLRTSTSAKRKERMEISKKIRFSTAQIRQFQRNKVDDFEMFEDASAYPIVFEQQYGERSRSGADAQEQGKLSSGTEGVHAYDECDDSDSSDTLDEKLKQDKHVVVFLHGFMGTSWDLRPFRNYLSIVDPNVVTLLSASNETDTDSDIRVLGHRLAREVSTFLKDYFTCSETGVYARLAKLSFVCHSIGSVILRSALTQPLMQQYVPFLHSFFSLSSPHLGSRGMSSTLVKYGMWAMRTWRRAKALGQLALADDSDPRKSYLYKLSQADVGIHLFANIVLVSSPQDQYVPYHSARIEPMLVSEGASLAEADLASEMSANILGKVAPESVLRLDLNFEFDNVKTARMDKFIGRAAHVKILDSPSMALALLLQYREKLIS